MTATRPLPWTDLVAAIGEKRFDEIREALKQARADELDRDAFLLNGAVVQLLKDLVPPEAPAEALNDYGALIHMMSVMWSRDWPLVPVTAEVLKAALASPPHAARRTSPVTAYVQLPPNLVWAEPSPGEPHEPLDGIFLIATANRADALAILGFRAARDGFTTMIGAIELPAPVLPARDSGGAAFASMLPAGDRRGLISVVDAHELCALALLAAEAGQR